MQNSKRVKVVKTQENLLRVPQDYSLCKSAMFVEETGHRAPGHPFDEQVHGATLLNGPKHSDSVPYREKRKND